MSPFDRRWPLADAVQLACILEAAAAKVGNVHPGRSFEHTHFGHFVASAMAIRPCFAPSTVESPPCDAPTASVGQLLLRTVEATLANVGSNTNLGMLLLFAPLAIASRRLTEPCEPKALRSCVADVLDQLTEQDAVDVYHAIRLANPGGLGERDAGDVHASQPPPGGLLAAMQQVASFDAVARQYTTNFADIFERLLPWLDEQLAVSQTPTLAIERLHLQWLAHEPDGLIVRKAGLATAERAQKLAQRAVDALAAWDVEQSCIEELPAVVELDRYLRADGNRRNPGTTADLIAATLAVRLLAGP